jgi:hypothetical protein
MAAEKTAPKTKHYKKVWFYPLYIMLFFTQSTPFGVNKAKMHRAAYDGGHAETLWAAWGRRDQFVYMRVGRRVSVSVSVSFSFSEGDWDSSVINTQLLYTKSTHI